MHLSKKLGLYCCMCPPGGSYSKEAFKKATREDIPVYGNGQVVRSRLPLA